MVLKEWQQAIHTVFQTLKSYDTQMPQGIERQFIMDDQNGHYQILDLGWENQNPVYDIMVHIDIKQNLIWVQADNTNHNIVEALLEQGVPKNQIVLGFHAPYKRPFTGFATG
jgi:hypothetical protein